MKLVLRRPSPSARENYTLDLEVELKTADVAVVTCNKGAAGQSIRAIAGITALRVGTITEQRN
jgi:hypothetical protein